MSVVGIVRHQQFRPSETFIADQALALREFTPLFVGRDAVRAASGVDSVSVADLGRTQLVTYTLTRRSARLQAELAARGVRLLHAHFGVEGVYVARFAKALGVPLVTTLHGFDVTIGKKAMIASGKVSWMNYVAWRRDLFREGALFICVSEYVRRRAVEWGYPAERLVVLPTGVDLDAIAVSGIVDAPRILHVARLVEVKGTADLIRAFALARAAIPDARLDIIGDGPLRAPLMDLVDRLNLGAAVSFFGTRPRAFVLSQLARSRVFCLPSITSSDGAQEGLGTVLLEAAATGRPTVGTDGGGIPEAVIDGKTGFLVPQRDVGGLADRLVTLLKDDGLCRRFGQAGRRLVEERFSLQSQTQRLEQLYRSLI